METLILAFLAALAGLFTIAVVFIAEIISGVKILTLHFATMSFFSTGAVLAAATFILMLVKPDVNMTPTFLIYTVVNLILTGTATLREYVEKHTKSN